MSGDPSLKDPVIFYSQELTKTKTPTRRGGGRMSGDIGLEDPVIFYTEEVTQTKKVLLSLKGIELAFIKEEEDVEL